MPYGHRRSILESNLDQIHEKRQTVLSNPVTLRYTEFITNQASCDAALAIIRMTKESAAPKTLGGMF
jgi:hypothetical protein